MCRQMAEERKKINKERHVTITNYSCKKKLMYKNQIYCRVHSNIPAKEEYLRLVRPAPTRNRVYAQFTRPEDTSKLKAF